MTEQIAYRVVGVRCAGDRVVVGDCVELAQAEQLRNRLLTAATFNEIVIEHDEAQAGKGTTEGEPGETVML